jgi:DNA-binding GntR family transcriptional regulator/DNA-binding XRE family transcriptional regulator
VKKDMVDNEAAAGPRLRERRQALGLSLDQLAQKARISTAHLSLIERSKRQPSTRLAAQLGEAVGLPDLWPLPPTEAGADGDGIRQLLHAVAASRRSAFDEDSRSRSLYQRLRRSIVEGDLRPNDRLVETDLARALKVSRTPIRECLQRLAADGLVEHRGRSWIIHEHTPDEISEIYEVRACLEGYAAFLASRRAGRQQRAAILGHAAERPPADSTDSDFVHWNESFHDAVIAAAGNRHLAETIFQSRQYYFNHRVAALYTPEDSQKARDDHQSIAEAIAKGDDALAQELSRRHVSDALRIVLRAAPATGAWRHD